ncbi:MAG: MEDS domain-containing protein [Candidatus Nitrosocosmicus sp.]
MSYLFYHDHKTPGSLFVEPLHFINTQNKFKHIVLYYDNVKFGKKIQYEFIKKGLLNKENCIYSIVDKEDTNIIENEMDDYGIDSKYYIKNGLLTIFKVPDLLRHPKGAIAASKEILNKMFSNINPNRPFRLVARFIDKLHTSEQVESNIILEKYHHNKFYNYNGSVMCHYDVSKYPVIDNCGWLKSILENHHSAIFITDDEGKGIAFDV